MTGDLHRAADSIGELWVFTVQSLDQPDADGWIDEPQDLCQTFNAADIRGGSLQDMSNQSPFHVADNFWFDFVHGGDATNDGCLLRLGQTGDDFSGLN